jgi:ubiquitin-protein ligase
MFSIFNGGLIPDITPDNEKEILDAIMKESIRVNTDENLEKVLKDSISVKNREDDELKRAIDASIEEAKPKPKKIRPKKNVNKILQFDLREVNSAKTFEIIHNHNKYKMEVSASFVNSNIQHWSVTFHTGKKLWGDMVWDIKFTPEFPQKPPKMRVIQPIFVPYTGHITIGGAICNPMLVSGQGWNSETEMVPLLISLINSMLDTDSPAKKLHDKSDERVQTYTEENAEAGRQRFYKNHKWSY